MQITTDQWAELRAAVVDDDHERFESLLNEAARVAVAHARDFAIRCDKVRSREAGVKPYAVWQR